MVVTELAEGSAAEHAGELIAAFGFPIVGLILLILGLRRRSRSRTPMLPPPGPYPYGYGPFTGGYPNPPVPPVPPTYPAAYPPGYPAPRPAGSSGTALVVVGSLLLAFGALGFLGRATGVVTKSAHAARVGDCLTQNDFRDNMLTPPRRECADPDSIFEVAAKGDPSANCPDGKLADSAYAYRRDGHPAVSSPG